MNYVIASSAVLILLLLIVYSFPVRRVPFNDLYSRVPENIKKSLQNFRKSQRLKQIESEGVAWKYLVVGSGPQTILFLHGMAGAYDIWWQIIDALRPRYRLISVTYPPVKSLAALSQGIFFILDTENVADFHLVGSSLGGYLAQYLVSVQPDRIKTAVFGNTFPPNNIIAEKTKMIAKILPVIPAWAVMQYLRRSAITSIYPASGKSEIVRAYMMEQAHGMMSKAQFLARYQCVIDHFAAPVSTTEKIPTLIIEADNDPLVAEELRTMLKATYPAARVKVMHAAGHFPYLNRPDEYTRILVEFLSSRREI